MKIILIVFRKKRIYIRVSGSISYSVFIVLLNDIGKSKFVDGIDDDINKKPTCNYGKKCTVFTSKQHNLYIYFIASEHIISVNSINLFNTFPKSLYTFTLYDNLSIYL